MSHLSLFSVDLQTGNLTYVESYATEQQPRGFAIDSSGRYLTASGQKSTQLSVYAIDYSSGKLNVGQYPVGKGANSVVDRLF